MALQTDYEQLMLELVNRARLDPEGEAERYGIDLNENLAAGTISATIKQPLAMNYLLIDSARAHSQWMINNDVFNHTGVNGSSPGDRMATAGYSFNGYWTWGENLSWRGSGGAIDIVSYIYSQHEGLFLSAGHRENILYDYFREIGIGQISGTFTKSGYDYNSLMITQNFATSGSNYFITGVAFNDTDHNAFYSVGEGRNLVSVSALSGTTQTISSGGYALYASSGTQNISFSGGGLSFAMTVQVTIGDSNIKLDVVDGDTIWSSTSLVLVSGIHKALLLGAADLSVTGTTGNDELTGNKGDNVLNGLAGADRLYGKAGADTLRGGSGYDFLDGGAGADTLIGNRGNDVYIVDNTDDRVREFINEGIDVVRSTVDFSLRDNALNVENLRLVADHAINGSGNYLNNMIWGNSFDNIIIGYNGNDRLFGGQGNDTLRGGNGADIMVGGPGSDWLYGANGNDKLFGHDGDDTLFGGAGNDLLNGGQGTDVMIGDYGDDTIYGNKGADKINGAQGNDILYGNWGRDILYGGAGADILIGGWDKDIQYAGEDSDVDTFIFNSQMDSGTGSNSDVIHKFDSGEDVIDLSGIDADISISGNQAFAFTGNSATANSVWLIKSNDDLILSADTTGDAVADFQIQFVQTGTLTEQDLIL